MNKLIIIGNLTRDPELRTTQDGTAVCNFTVAVNRKARTDGHPEADYFRVTAWRTLGESCAKYLTKGKKVCVIGAISARGIRVATEVPMHRLIFWPMKWNS